MPEQRKPDKICRVGGKEFFLYRERDELDGQSILVYPDFAEHPEYTGEGRPFATAADEGCSHGKPKEIENAENADYSVYGDCGGCAYFHREETPYDVIGVCMCDALRRDGN